MEVADCDEVRKRYERAFREYCLGGTGIVSLLKEESDMTDSLLCEVIGEWRGRPVVADRRPVNRRNFSALCRPGILRGSTSWLIAFVSLGVLNVTA